MTHPQWISHNHQATTQPPSFTYCRYPFYLHPPGLPAVSLVFESSLALFAGGLLPPGPSSRWSIVDRFKFHTHNATWTFILNCLWHCKQVAYLWRHIEWESPWEFPAFTSRRSGSTVATESWAGPGNEASSDHRQHSSCCMCWDLKEEALPQREPDWIQAPAAKLMVS